MKVEFHLTEKQMEKLIEAANKRQVKPIALARTVVTNWLLRNK